MAQRRTEEVPLDAGQAGALAQAMWGKALETERYLAGLRGVGDEPGPLDSCCSAHLARWREDLDSKRRLASRLESERALATMMEALADRLGAHEDEEEGSDDDR